MPTHAIETGASMPALGLDLSLGFLVSGFQDLKAGGFLGVLGIIIGFRVYKSLGFRMVKNPVVRCSLYQQSFKQEPMHAPHAHNTKAPANSNPTHRLKLGLGLSALTTITRIMSYSTDATVK